MGRVARTARKRSEPGAPATRDLLMQAAGELMIERGSVDISLSDIAQRSGLNSALVKYYFGGKNGLLLELLRTVLGPPMAELAPLLDMPMSAPEKLRIHISGVVNSYFKYPYVNRLMHYLLAEDQEEFGRVIADEIARPLADAQASILRQGVEEGVFRETDPMLFYFHLIGACDHLFYGAYILRHVFSVEAVNADLKRRYVDHLYNVVLEGITARR